MLCKSRLCLINTAKISKQIFCTMKNNTLNLSGIFPPVATPFDKNENLALDKFVENLQKYDKIDFRGLVVLGSNGEFPFLSTDEKLQLIKTAKQNMSPGKILVVGAGCEGTKMTLDLCEKFANTGADAVLIHTPHFFKSLMTEDALDNHYRKIADKCALPVILYNVPSNTGIEITFELAVKLSTHSNIIGLKDSGGDVKKMAKIVDATKQNNFQVLAGSAHFLMDAMLSGSVGGVCAIANILGADTVNLAKLCSENRIDDAKLLQARLTPPNLAVTRKHGVPALKYMMDKFGYYGGPLRSPLLPLTEDLRRIVEQEFVANGFTF